MPELGTLHIMIIADRNALRSSLCCQLAALLQEHGLKPGQYRFHTHRTVEDGLAHLFGNPPFMMDLIVCWNTQPKRAQKMHGRPACPQRDHEASRMTKVLLNFEDLQIPVIGIAADPVFIGADLDPTSTLGMIRDRFPDCAWFQQENTELILYGDHFGSETTCQHMDGRHLNFIADLCKQLLTQAA